MARVELKQIWCSKQIGRKERGESDFLGMEDNEDMKGDVLRKKSLVGGGVIRTLIYVLSKEVEVSEL